MNVLAKYFFVLLAMAMSACGTVEGSASDDDEYSNSGTRQSSAGNHRGSSAWEESSSGMEISSSSSESKDSLLSRYTDWIKVSASSVKRGQLTYSVSAFEIGKTEVSQHLYREIMATLPEMKKTGDQIPVANLNWYEAVLFCNALSKKVGLDTAYVYERVGSSNYLENLTIDYSVESVRLPTEYEWEVAYRGGTSGMYYWGTDKASEYAYYGQTNGPTEVAQYKPNSYGIYDMGGNVAEWTNDWFGSKPTNSQTNYTGPEKGSAKVVRGGGWSDVAKVMAADSTSKRDPLYQSEKLGLRIVHSVGF